MYILEISIVLKIPGNHMNTLNVIFAHSFVFFGKTFL